MPTIKKTIRTITPKNSELQDIRDDIIFLKSLHPNECNERERQKAIIENEKNFLELERLQRIAEEEIDRLKQVEIERLKQVEIDRLKQVEIERIKQVEMERLKQEEDLKFRKEQEQITLLKIEIPEEEPPADHKICGKIDESEDLDKTYSDDGAEYSEITDLNEIEEHLKEEDPTPATVQEKVLQNIGSIEFEELLCDDCYKTRENYINANKAEGPMTYNLFNLNCKACLKARFNSYKQKKAAKKEQEKAEKKNIKLLSKVKCSNKKVELQNKLKSIKEGSKEGSNDKIINKLEKISTSKQGKLNLNIFIKK